MIFEYYNSHYEVFLTSAVQFEEAKGIQGVLWWH